MLNGAVSGKINKIIVKSIARFARNTEEALIVQKQIDALNNKKAKLEENKSVMILAKSRLEEIEKIINSDINGFDEDTFTNLVDEVIIRKRYEIEFKFKCGISKNWLVE